MLYHDSHSPEYRSPIGPVKAGETLTVRFWCDESDCVDLRIWQGKEAIYRMNPIGNDRFEASVTMPQEPMLLWYDFIIHRQYDTARYGTSADQLGGVGMYCAGQPASYQVTVYSPDYKTPEYLRKGVMYQIFPDRFYKDANATKGRVRKIAQAHPEAVFHKDWNEKPNLDLDPENGDNRALDFFGGTLTGIRQKLDDLQKLGVTILYLNPIFRARTNHRYDTGSYDEIDPIVGDEKAFQELCRAASKRDMHIILDGVFSHTGADSLYFNRYGRYASVGAYQSLESPYAEWYHFRRFPDKYNCWWGFYTLPAVNKNQPSYRRYLLNPFTGILPGWIQKGAGGWRLDVADELPMDMIRQMRKAVRQADGDAALIGEVWEDASNKVAYGVPRCYGLGDTLDSVMNYPLRRAIIDFFIRKIGAGQLRRVILHQQEVYPAPFYYSLMNLLGSHDRVRILNALSGYDQQGAIQLSRLQAGEVQLTPTQLSRAKRRYVSALKLLCALPGVPTVYYGDEVGMTGMADPWNRAPMNWQDGDQDLRGQVARVLLKRRKNPMLQTGYLNVEAPDVKTLLITRYAVDGRDVFGDPLPGKPVTVKITR